MINVGLSIPFIINWGIIGAAWAIIGIEPWYSLEKNSETNSLENKATTKATNMEI
jgi:hypothetical protein